MTLKWLVLTTFVKAIFLVAPFLDISSDFNLSGDELAEAKEFAAASSTKAMLFASPILLALQTVNQTSQVCHAGIAGVSITVFVFVMVVVLVCCNLYIPTRWFRGTLARFLWFFGLMVFEIVFEICLLMRVAKVLCA